MTQEHMLRGSFSVTSDGDCGSLEVAGGDGGGGGGFDDGGCGGAKSKKIKHKKVPQRGLGVAQLEKIRLDEQQKKEAALQAANILANNASGSHSDTTAGLAISCPSFRPNLHPPSNSISLPAPAPMDLPSPNFLYRPVQLSKTVEVFHPNSVNLVKPLNAGGKEMGLPAMPAPGHGNWNRLWNGEQNLEGEKRILDHRRFGVWPRVNFRYESKAIVLPLQPKSHHFQHPPPSSMVNVSSGISSSSVLKFQIEPPSNQNFRDKSYGPLTPAEEKMVAMKRSYPFSVESQSAPSCRCKFQPTSVSSISQSDESASYSNGCTTHLEPSNKSIRDDPSNTTPLPEQNASGSIRENRELNGDILTLAPPAPAASLLGSKHKHPPANSGCPRHGILDFRSPSSKEFTRDPIGNPRPGGLTERSPFSFFPPKDQATTNAQDGTGKIGEAVDLSLKL